MLNLTDPSERKEWLAGLLKLQREARDELDQLGWGPKWTMTNDQVTNARVHCVSWLVAHINYLFDALESGDFWNAVAHARSVGMYQGRREGLGFTPAYKSLAAHLEEVADLLRPDAEKGRAQVAYARKGGHTSQGWRKADVPDEDLRAAVERYQEEGETLTNARRRVSRDYAIPLSTLRRRTAD